MLANVQILGHGRYLPEVVVEKENGTRYQVAEGISLLDIGAAAARQALDRAGLTAADLDALVFAGAVGHQPIPATSALLHERLQADTAAAIDINTTCSSFVTAFEFLSMAIRLGRYNKVLIVSADLASSGINPNQAESSTLFSDGAAAFVIAASDDPAQGVIGAAQQTWSEGAHSTEIRGGLLGLHPREYANAPEDFMFDMHGRTVLRLARTRLPQMFDDFLAQVGVTPTDITFSVPHQASPVIPMMTKKLGMSADSCYNRFADLGNMVSASIPFAFSQALDEGLVGPGDRVLLWGTAAGLTANLLYLQI
jgi:3-oxoacyl-[acyl-carrier-protein] synthase-3